MKVSIVIPNYNGRNVLEKNLQKVIDACPACEIIIVDDKSADDSVMYLADNFPGVTVVQKQLHEGYASTVNAGVKASKGEIVVLLNTDIVPEPGFLEFLLPHFGDTRIFAVGCMDKSHEENGITERGRGVASWQRGLYIHARGDVGKSDTAWVSGGSGAFRKRTWDSLGGMDEIYNPFYWEDIDLSYRARKAGYETVFERRSIVHHYHSEGSIKTQFTPRQVKEIAYRNQFLFVWKNLTDPGLFFAHMMWMPVHVFRALLTGDVSLSIGFIKALALLPEITVRRRSVRQRQTIPDGNL